MVQEDSFCPRQTITTLLSIRYCARSIGHGFARHVAEVPRLAQLVVYQDIAQRAWACAVLACTVHCSSKSCKSRVALVSTSCIGICIPQLDPKCKKYLKVHPRQVRHFQDKV